MELRIVYENFLELVGQYSTNLSAGGIFIATSDPHPVGTHLELVVRLPGKRPALLVHAEVRWTDGSGMGVQFLFESDDERQSVQSAIDEVLRETA
jgi:uncharacterized protein (TIGR02266 family)